VNRLCMLLTALNGSRDPEDIQAASDRYFAEIPDEDLAWGVFLLRGGRLKRQCPPAVLKQWCVDTSGIPPWLVEECIAASRDNAEAVALIIPSAGQAAEQRLSRVMGVLKQIEVLPVDHKREPVIKAWSELRPYHRVLFNRLLMGRSLTNLPAQVVHRSLSKRTDQREEIIAFRLGQEWDVLDDDLHAFLHRRDDTDSHWFAYPFHPVGPLEGEPEHLGNPLLWVADTLRGQNRVQIIKRGGAMHLWSDGGEWMEERAGNGFLRNALPDGTVLECSVSPQRTLSAHDILEYSGEDIRTRSVEERRELLDAVLRGAPPERLTASGRIAFSDWDALRTAREGIRDRGTHILLKRNGGVIDTDARTDRWRLWRADPLTIDAVLLSVRRSDGGVAPPYSEMTLAVWTGDRLVPCARVHPSLPEHEMTEIVRFVENNTTERFGPVRSVSPSLVFTIGFDAVRNSARRKSGLALTNPRILRWHRTRRLTEAATLDQLRAMVMVETW
jgi:hypothetical protein